MNVNEKFNLILSVCGAICGYLFGGLDVLLGVFATILILDTLTGMFKALYKGDYKSKTFRLGIFSKTGYMFAVILAVQLDRVMGDTGALRTALLFCFIANEATSIVENLGEVGVPFPAQITNAIAVLKNKGNSESNNKTE